MNRGAKAGILLTGLALAGCAATAGKLEIKPIADAGEKFRHGNVDVAAARGQLALGNVGLALEAFRRINRDRPGDPTALAGIGDCYASMGRFDLAQSNYESALAMAPRDPALLLGLARVFEREGDVARGIELRAEATRAQIPAAPPAAVPTQITAQAVMPAAPPADVPWIKSAHIGSVTVQLPKPRPADRLAADESRMRVQVAHLIAPSAPAPSVTLALPPARPAPDVGRVRVAQLVGPSAPAPSVTLARPPARPAPEAGRERVAQLVAPRAPVPSVTFALPPTRPVPDDGREQPARITAALAVPEPVRIERISPREVMLVTSGRSLWQPQIVSRTLASTTVRWIPLRGSATPPNVQVLNAARRQGLAASARSVLVDRGWRRIAIGNASDQRETSVVLYPRSRAALGRSLAAQFGIGSQLSEGDVLVLVLGRDRADVARRQRKS
jgi:tetratricopeptide (TPR) repeat protein